MYTIEEAKTKWCPMVKPTSPALSNGGAYRNEDADYLCIADQCMWWVWEEEIYYPDAREYSEYPPKTIGRCGRVKT